MGQPLRGYSGHQLEVVGQAMIHVSYEQQTVRLPLVVIAGMHKPALFGRNWLASIKIQWNEIHQVQSDRLQQILDKHSALFVQSVGTI